jgi:hypothetical protein
MLQVILGLLKQRRVWAGIVGVLAIVCEILKVSLGFDVPGLTDALTSFGGAISAVIISGLAVWSLIQPKKAEEKPAVVAK